MAGRFFTVPTYVRNNELQMMSTKDVPEGDTTAAKIDIPILKYDDPVLARPRPGFDMELGHDSLPQYVALYSSNEERQQPQKHQFETGRVAGTENCGAPPIGAKCRRPRGGHLTDETLAVLKAIIPNKEWRNEEGDWVQTVGTRE